MDPLEKNLSLTGQRTNTLMFYKQFIPLERENRGKVNGIPIIQQI